jgi:hypothetical protein
MTLVFLTVLVEGERNGEVPYCWPRLGRFKDCGFLLWPAGFAQNSLHKC